METHNDLWGVTVKGEKMQWDEKTLQNLPPLDVAWAS